MFNRSVDNGGRNTGKNRNIFTDMLLVLVVLPLLVHSTPIETSSRPVDCEDVYNNGSIHNGVYTIYPAGTAGEPVQVYCDMGCKEDETHGDERWTVIQRRIDGSVNFFQPWVKYKNGFGNPNGEYWLGLENIFLLTYMERYHLRVDLEDFSGGSAYSEYRSFSLDTESNSYALQISDFIDGGAGDPMSSLNGRIFSTYDKNPYGSCVDSYYGGFWYTCWFSNGAINPNGLYKDESIAAQYLYDGILWNSWKYFNSLKSISMKIRRVNVDDVSDM